MQPSTYPWFRSIEQRIKVNSSNQERKPFFSNVSEYLFEDCISFLENPPIIKQYSKKDFKVGVCASQLAVAMCSEKYDLLTKIFLWQKVIKKIVILKKKNILCLIYLSLIIANRF